MSVKEEYFKISNIGDEILAISIWVHTLAIQGLLTANLAVAYACLGQRLPRAAVSSRPMRKSQSTPARFEGAEGTLTTVVT